MFGSKVKTSSAQAAGASYSGIGDFAPSNLISLSRPLVDLGKPANWLAIAGLSAVAYLAWKKI